MTVGKLGRIALGFAGNGFDAQLINLMGGNGREHPAAEVREAIKKAWDELECARNDMRKKGEETLPDFPWCAQKRPQRKVWNGTSIGPIRSRFHSFHGIKPDYFHGRNAEGLYHSLPSDVSYSL